MIPVLIFIAIVGAVVGLRSVLVVPADGAYVVERLGRYHRTLQPGLHVLTPFFDRIAFRYSLTPKDEELTETGITHDNIPASVGVRYRWQIADPKAAAYESADVGQFVAGIVRAAVRQWVSECSWSDLRETTRELRVPAAQAGVKVSSVEVKQVERVAG